MGQTLTLVPSTGGPDTPDTPVGWSYKPHAPQFELFTDSGSLAHVLVGGALVQLGPIPALIGSIAFLGYQFSQVTEPMARTAGEMIELAIGMAISALLWRRK